jgi:hypothetical protein
MVAKVYWLCEGFASLSYFDLPLWDIGIYRVEEKAAHSS